MINRVSLFHWPKAFVFRKFTPISRMLNTRSGEPINPICLGGSTFFIDGKFVKPSASCGSFESYDPCTGAIAATLPTASKEMVSTAIEAASNALSQWREIPGSRRASYLLKLASLVEENSEKLAAIESFDCGKPLREAEVDMKDVASCLRTNAEYAQEVERMQDTPVEIGSNSYETRLRYEPYGVVSLITPWNYPLLMAVQKVAAALAAGCTCVLKPSEYASMTCIEFADLCRHAELPHGVFNLVTGVGSVTGPPMISHPAVRKISFTGSVVTGRALMKAAADFVKPVHLELGGKSPLVIFDDANISAAVDWIMTGIFWGCGQVCSATSRVLVHQSVYQKVCDLLKQRSEALTVGMVGTREVECPVDMGPLVSLQQYLKVSGTDT
eukprot:GHVS01096954.1.p1 GENE.GHVS01096954.1~~GHVS01096954.1.p1  ORF type:complete len:385 (-),score=12.38 GHVS01096954.1:768-1922(-)